MEEHICINSEKQLFIDERFIATRHNISLTVNPPVKAGPVDFDGGSSGMVGIVTHAGQYWMYFQTARSEVGGYDVAISEDGLAWRRPGGDGIFGHARELPLPGLECGSVFIDPKDSEYPFKGIFGVSRADAWGLDPEKFGYVMSPHQTQAATRGGLFLFRSHDGLKWEIVDGTAVPFLADTQNQVLYDPRIDRYVVYLRAFPRAFPTLGGPPKKGRCVARTETDDLYKMPWPYTPDPSNKPQPPHDYPYINSELPIVMAADDQDPASADLYGPNVEVYRWAQDVYLAFPGMYRSWGYSGRNISYGRDHRGTISNDGLIETHLCVSRDGVNWHRYRTPYVDAGLLRDTEGHNGDPDCGTIWMVFATIRKGDEIWQYYYGTRRTHMTPANGVKLGLAGSAVFRLVQRLDGFVSVDADHLGGEFTTPSVRFTGTRLVLNAACHGLGEIWVEIQDEQGHPIPGHTLEDAVSIDRNGVAQEVWWKAGPDVRHLAGKPVRLQFKMRSAKLYAFQFVSDPSSTSDKPRS